MWHLLTVAVMTTVLPMIHISPTTPTAMHLIADTDTGPTGRPTTSWAALATSVASVAEHAVATTKLKIMKRTTQDGTTTSTRPDMQVLKIGFHIDEAGKLRGKIFELAT